jgi:Ca2+-binding RTX toxin-like protein
MIVEGTSGDDDLAGTEDVDDFYMDDGGNDICHGLGGNDSFAFGLAFDDDDQVFGGAGLDSIYIGGVAGDLHLSNKVIDSVEVLLLFDFSDYTLHMKNSAVAKGDTLFINGGALGIGHSLKVFASTELNGKYAIAGGADNDIIETGLKNDTIDTAAGADAIASGFGRDTINSGSGADVIYFHGDGALTANDRVNGGGDADNDTLDISGDYSAGLTVKSKTLTDIDTIVLRADDSYTLDFSGAAAGLGQVEIDASELGAADVLDFTAAGNKHVAFVVKGGSGNDAIAAGKAEGNELEGNGGADTLTANKKQDVLTFAAAPDSTGSGYDTVAGFDAEMDLINVRFTVVPGVPAAVDPKVKGGTLSAATFDADLEAAVGTGELDVDHAVLYRAKFGDLADKWFLIVDGNGEAGYQGGEDLVVYLQDPRHIGGLSLASFGEPA